MRFLIDSHNDDLEIAAKFADRHGLETDWIEATHIRRRDLRE